MKRSKNTIIPEMHQHKLSTKTKDILQDRRKNLTPLILICLVILPYNFLIIQNITSNLIYFPGIIKKIDTKSLATNFCPLWKTTLMCMRSRRCMSRRRCCRRIAPGMSLLLAMCRCLLVHCGWCGHGCYRGVYATRCGSIPCGIFLRRHPNAAHYYELWSLRVGYRIIGNAWTWSSCM